MIRIENSADKAEIYISGDIIDDDEGAIVAWWGDGDAYQWPSDIKKQLDEVKGKDLTVYINSSGGSVPAGVAIANMIKRHDGHTTAVVDGWCCSIATQIFFAADDRQIPKNAYLMIHKPAISIIGNADDLGKAITFLNTIQEGIETVYNDAANDDVTPETIHDMVNDETWLTGEQAKQYFDVTVLDSTQTVAKAGKSANMKNIPAEIVAAWKKQNAANDAEQKANQQRLQKEMSNKITIAVAKAKGVLAE